MSARQGRSGKRGTTLPTFAISTSSSSPASSSDCSNSLPSRMPLVIRDLIQSRSETSFPAASAPARSWAPWGRGDGSRCPVLEVTGTGAPPSAQAGPFLVRGFITLRNSADSASSPSFDVAAPGCDFFASEATVGTGARAGVARRGRLLGLGAGASFTPCVGLVLNSVVRHQQARTHPHHLDGDLLRPPERVVEPVPRRARLLFRLEPYKGKPPQRPIGLPCDTNVCDGECAALCRGKVGAKRLWSRARWNVFDKQATHLDWWSVSEKIFNLASSGYVNPHFHKMVEQTVETNPRGIPQAPFVVREPLATSISTHAHQDCLPVRCRGAHWGTGR